ncbi:MAG: hypothetical protein PHD32_09125 [Eubacteriales bacterium]|nr:hypothetical protein [Eubacteriales bacterium]
MDKCTFQMEPGACLITASPSTDVLPGRMLRGMVRNLERRFELYEYSLARSQKEADAMGNVEAVVPLSGGIKGKLSGGAGVVVFQRLHPSFYDPNYVTLEPEDEEEFRFRLQPGEPFIVEDYTVALPDELFIAVTDDIKLLVRVMSHLKLTEFADAREAVSKLGVANLSVFEEAELLVEYDESAVPGILAGGLDEFLEPPEHVDRLDI